MPRAVKRSAGPVPEIAGKMSRILSRLRRALPFSSGVAATIQTLAVNILILGVNFGTGIITARALGPDGRGAQAAMQMWPQIFAIALTLGLHTALLYNLRRYPEKGSQLFSAALIMGTGMGLLATLAGVAFIPLWLTEYSPEVVRFAQWLMLGSPLILLINALYGVLRARDEFTAFNTIRCLLPLSTLLILVSLWVFYRLTPFYAAAAYIVPWAPLLLWMVYHLWRTYHPTLRDVRESFRLLTSYGIRSYGVDLLGQLVAGRLDRILVVGLLNPTAMGLYVVAVSLARTLDAFPAAVAQVVLPRSASRPVEEVVALTGRGLRVSTTLAVVAALVLAGLGPLALKTIYGQEFSSAVPVLRILLVEVVLSGATWVLAQAFMASDRPGITSIMQGIGVGLTVPLLIVLVPRYGLVGAGLALLTSTVVRFVFAIANFPISLKVRPPRMWPRWSDFTSIIRRRGDDREGRR